MKRIEMIGRPLGHVRTPGLLNERLAAQGLALRVVCREVAPEGLAAYVNEARREVDLVGLVVTTPLKEAICRLLDRRTALVELIGCCNCIRIDSGSWIGANFDGFGFAHAVAEAGLALARKRVLLLGCGGAGKAIAERIVSEGAAALVIDDPAPGKAFDFAARLASPILTVRGAGNAEPFDLVVNASTLGMREDDPSPAAPETIARCGAVVDIVISARESRLRRIAREYGKPFVEGASMVRGQIDLFRTFLLSQASSETAARPAP
jgi:shikimate dehydrogenase